MPIPTDGRTPAAPPPAEPTQPAPALPERPAQPTPVPQPTPPAQPAPAQPKPAPAVPSSPALPDARVCAQVGRAPFELASSDGVTTLGGDVWLPPAGVEVRATVQLVHGMTEHVGRYDAFARSLAALGCAVVGHDHLAHGRSSAAGPDGWGVLDPHRGAALLVADVGRVRAWVEGHFPDVPHVIFGHSMGSFVTRAYLGEAGAGLAGALVFGTGWQPGAALALGRAVTSLIGAIRGWDVRSKLVDGLAVGAYARRFAGERADDLAWLTRDAASCDAYAADPACGFVFSVGAYHALFDLVGMAQDRARVRAMPPELPVLLASGSDDPVGGCGVAVPRVAELMRSCGVRDVEERLYPGARHELHNETNRDEVLADVLSWLARKGILR